jgi:AcrR family transcriptional regulator
MSTDPAPRWRRLEPDERKEQIFICAVQLFSQRPYSDVSTSDIAADAGVARGLINHYFGTKRELYLAVIKRALTVPRLAVTPRSRRKASGVTSKSNESSKKPTRNQRTGYSKPSASPPTARTEAN